MAAIPGLTTVCPVAVRTLRSAAWVLLSGVVAASAAQPADKVQLSLRETSPLTSCTLDVVTSATAGEAILHCTRTSPASNLGAHRALTAVEAARLFALSTTRAQSRPDRPSADSGRKSTLVVVWGTERVSLDVSQAPERLVDDDRELWRMLRAIADELRGTSPP